ncbi:MAG: DUF3426 domain-containing protein [Zetaproteobacteria bacterium CG12_big_fil_rev_8_21_14_0_65_54_13]|nr:MAG: DUF3426 domain-containing protein [Zetaproteobacteria bacterium CG23_combo_of_CG06-09_8_20_14_all_54_7]PIW50968.1 MAG: DUF3426 domain-containing protein [Zetaproteobacteria bacterium CG12_big_fil_rev_8_21_14_0_65_54_13]PIX54834.1 MAG: DUF3426 domain-containing protein [Zetaproteobacteria bacterium CG_4_10_14_3_um_filter_54_28]PJA29529.1 MAG: DUF3426 domain-containing protein [Zetaproteobacteria bacterium CG_4_9_14_3_um_filter_54_145]
MAPQRRDAHLGRWFIVILLLLAGGGFLLQKDAWLDNRWFRSSLMQVGFDLPVRAKDWQIEPESIHPRWITRDDGRRILLVRGTIRNLLASDMPVPQLLVRFFSAQQPDQPLDSTITRAILMPHEDDLRTATFLNPARDLSPVLSRSSHPFTILLQDVPENTADFTLLPTTEPVSVPAHD